MENKTLGSFIAFLRKEKRLTQKQLAELLNVSDKTVSHWECDETSPDISVLPQLSEILGVSVDELLKGEKKAPQPSVEHHYIPPKSESVFNKAGNFASRTFNNVKSKMSGDIAERYRYFRMLSLVGTVIACVVILIITLVNFIAGNYFLTSMAFIPGIVAFIGSLWTLVISLGFTLVARFAFYKNIYPSAEDDEEEKKYIYKANSVCFNNLFLVFCTLPVSLTGIQDILGYAVILNLLITVFCLVILRIVLIFILNKKGILKTDKKKILRIKCSCICVALITFGITAGFLIQELWRPSAEAIVFYNAEEFIAYMETPAEKPENAYIIDGVSPTIGIYEGIIIEDDSDYVRTEEITVNGQTVYFKWLNKAVYTYAEDDDCFNVITYEDAIRSQQQFDMRDDILSVIFPFYCIPVIIISFVVYKKKSKNLIDD